MPGYYIHLAASNSKNRENKKFIKGIIMPDLLKDYFINDFTFKEIM